MPVFEKGRSGNPLGRPRRKPITSEIERILREKAPGDVFTNAHMIAWKLVQLAIAGDVPAAKLILEYIEGRPPQAVEINLRQEAARVADMLGVETDEVLHEVELILAGRT